MGTKKGGRVSLSVQQRKSFALLLYTVIQERCGTFEQFKKLLAKKRARVSEGTVRGWIPPLERLNTDPSRGSGVRPVDWSELKTPDLPGLLEVADVLDVSIEFLLGYPVPQRRSDREPPGELARALVEHVIRKYCARSAHSRRDGLAEVVGGRWLRRPTATEGKQLDGVVADVGNPGLRQHLWLQVENPQRYLEQVTEMVFDNAERWEDKHKEPERQAVRDAIGGLMQHVPVLATRVGKATEDLLQILLAAALSPLSPDSQASVTSLRQHHLPGDLERLVNTAGVEAADLTEQEPAVGASKKAGRGGRKKRTASQRGRR